MEKKEMSRQERKEANRQDRKRAKAKRARNKEFARVTYVFVALFLAMMAYIVYFQVEESQDIIKSPYNARQDSNADRVIRGTILDRNGNVLAETDVAEDGTETRVYPYSNMFAHVLGYSVQGKTGLESEVNYELLTSNAFFLEKLKNEFQDQKNMGDTVVTTLDVNLQQAAYDALGSYKGAVVVMEPSTGKILAMVSKPDYDPNTVLENWESLNANEESVLVNRATQGQYAPGSTFKLITALEYMRENSGYAAYSYECTGSIEQDNTEIHCYNGTVHGTVNLQDSLAYSCNTSFSNIGLSLDVSSFQETAKDLLFNSSLPYVLPYSESSFTLDENSSSADQMMTAMGQGQTEVSPYHMALITCAIANGGVLMKPYLVNSVTNYSGAEVDKTTPEKYKTLMTSEEAAQLKQYMSSVVDYGTASVLSGQGYTAAGKTGTAEYSTDTEKDHSWFVGMSNVDNPELVISVIIEASDGTASAVNVAKQIFDSYYY
jgi:peptidoglycan glycosyltransferase